MLIFYFFLSKKVTIKLFFFFSSRRRHTRSKRDWSSDVCSSDLGSWVAEAGDAIVDPGAPVHMVTQVATDGATEAVEIGGYSIIQADSVEGARAVLSSHPYVGRGGILQVNQ